MKLPWLIICAILLVLSPGIMYAVALLVTALASRYYRARCPRCGGRGLRSLGLTMATVFFNGRRAPDYWIDYTCELCGAEVRKHRGAWEDRPRPRAT
jgi:DNA-directed RNA polymerase subunit RPC12/RpoP